MGLRDRVGRRLKWRVDERATSAELASDQAPPPGSPAAGRVVYVDENGQPRRLPADLSRLSTDERDAAIAALSQALGAPAPDYARMAAIERLTELRAAGKMSEEQYHKERRRLESY